MWIHTGGPDCGAKCLVRSAHHPKRLYSWGAFRLTPTPPLTFWPLWPVGGGGSLGAAGLGSQVPQHTLPQNDPLVALVILNTHTWGF